MLSLEEEMLVWTSYRYCIGRHTYVSCLAPYIGQTYYDKLTDDKLAFMSEDIRNCIAQSLKANTPSFTYDIYSENLNPIADYLQWLTDNISNTKDLAGIKEIICGISKGEKVYYLTKTERPLLTAYESDFYDLLAWEDLASFFDKKNYKTVTVNHDGKEEDILCFESWKKQVKPDNNGYYTYIPWKWEKCYKSIENYLEGKLTYINPDYIVKVC